MSSKRREFCTHEQEMSVSRRRCAVVGWLESVAAEEEVQSFVGIYVVIENQVDSPTLLSCLAIQDRDQLYLLPRTT